MQDVNDSDRINDFITDGQLPLLVCYQEVREPKKSPKTKINVTSNEISYQYLL